MAKEKNKQAIEIAYAWCLAWGDGLQPQVNLSTLNQMREAMSGKGQIPTEVEEYVKQTQTLNNLPYPQTLDDLQAIAQKHPELWESKIGLVYGGATKIKQYVFEASKLQDIRGASALLDRINLIDLPAFFNKLYEPPNSAEQNSFRQQFSKARDWLAANAPSSSTHSLLDVLIPELIIYSTGGNILAFCPAAYVHQLADVIEKRYTQETLTANSCAVGDTFHFLELRFGLLKDPIENSNWLEWYKTHAARDLVKAYYGVPETDLAAQFERRKSFNELVGKLATRFNQRRSGHDWPEENRPSRRYPPMFETHPYVRRDESERRSAVHQASRLPGEPWFSDASARKRITGQKAKRDSQSTAWYNPQQWLNSWEPGEFDSWVNRFDRFLKRDDQKDSPYRNHPHYADLETAHKEARSLKEVGNASKGFVAYIYADGNNMGGYIQKITKAEDYQQFSKVVSEATEQSVYYALARHLQPHQLHNIDDAETQGRNGQWIHPFEILTIGGDDVMLVVPATKALAIAKTISEEFERILLKLDAKLAVKPEDLKRSQKDVHRYQLTQAKASQCQLSMSAGVLITADDTPIYYAENLTNQLLKSAKKKAKDLKQDLHYYGGTIDFLVMKSVTMLSSKVKEFRDAGLTIDGKPKLKLYAAPYTLHEIGGLLETAKALKEADFPRSQIYQIRSFLERGKNTAMLNYRYFWSRLTKKAAKDKLKEVFEDAWCKAKTNDGNLVPWMCVQVSEEEKQKSNYVATYETIWRELVDLYPFVDEPEQTPAMSAQANGEER